MPRRREPTQLKLLKGAAASTLNPNEPVAVDVLPVFPNEADAPPEVVEIWDYTVAHLDRMKLASACDRDALFAYCWAVYTHRQAGVLLTNSTLLVLSPTGSEVPNPAIKIQREAATTMRSFAQEFGLTPSARASIELPKGADDDGDNPFDVETGS